jgi:hypothetical protein
MSPAFHVCGSAILFRARHCSDTAGCLSFHPMDQCVVHALNRLACRARVTPASSPASHCKQCLVLTSPSLHARGCASPSRARRGHKKHYSCFSMGPKLRHPAVANPDRIFLTPALVCITAFSRSTCYQNEASISFCDRQVFVVPLEDNEDFPAVMPVAASNFPTRRSRRTPQRKADAATLIVNSNDFVYVVLLKVCGWRPRFRGGGCIVFGYCDNSMRAHTHTACVHPPRQPRFACKPCKNHLSCFAAGFGSLGSHERC